MSVIHTAQSLVRIPSVNPACDASGAGEAEVVRWLTAWAEQHRLSWRTEEVTQGRSNIVFQVSGGRPAGPRLLFNGHMDTVAAHGMKISPFAGELRDGRLWGRGAADMKGPLACMLHAMARLQKERADWRGTVTLACVVDEEIGFAGIRHFLRNPAAHDFAIVGEPTSFQVVRGCKGFLRFSIRARGRAAHSSRPEKGANAISAMAHACVRLEQFFADELRARSHPTLGSSTGSIGTICGGSGINVVADLCELAVDVRLVPGQSWVDTYSRIQEVAAIALPGIAWEFDAEPTVDLPFCLESDHPFVTAACEAFGLADSQVVDFSCDASKIAAAGIPCVIYGPGNIEEAHTVDESISIADLERGVEDYVRFAKELLKI